MNRKVLLYFGSVVLFVCMCIGFNAFAGQRYSNSDPVVIPSSKYASGCLGGTYNTAVSSYYIGCSVTSTPSSVTVSCAANAPGGSLSCNYTATNAYSNLVMSALAMSNDTCITFYCNTSNVLTSIYTYQWSYYRPKNPAL